MFILIKIAGFAAVKLLLVGIPESVELLVFGIGLVAVVGLLRWFLGRGEAEKPDDKFDAKGITNN